MPESYELHDGRFIQTEVVGSAADALDADMSATPEGRVRTVLAAFLYATVSEIRKCSFHIVARNGVAFPVVLPQSFAVTSLAQFPCLTQGMEIVLYPHEFLRARRDVATAGSSIIIYTRFIETDLPYYSYAEPQGRVVLQKKKHGSVFRSTGSVSVGGSGDLGSEAPPRGGGGEPQPY